MSERIDTRRTHGRSAHRTKISGRARQQATSTSVRTGIHPVVWSLVALGASLGILAAIFAGTFRVQQVRVVGNGLPRGEIIQRSGVLGQNVFTIQSDQVVSRLAGVGIIAVRRVDTSFPDQVTIYARRRIAMVGWRRGQALYLLDPDGRIIEQVRTTRLPIIASARDGSQLGPGVVTAVREAVRLLPAAPRGAIAGFTYGPKSGLIIDGTAGWRAVLGRGSPLKMVTRVATLVSLLQRFKVQGPDPWIVLNRPSPYMGNTP